MNWDGHDFLDRLAATAYRVGAFRDGTVGVDLELTGKVALVTGGSEGIGRATAESLAREGARVAICARRHDVLERAASEIRAATGGEVLPVTADVSRAADLEQCVKVVEQRLGPITLLVNNAGASAAGPFEKVTDEA